MRILLLALALIVSSAQAAPDLAQSVRERLVQAPVMRGEFEQQKQVQGFAKPLISRGSFVVARGRGVLWTTRTPFASQLKLTRDQIVASQDGKTSFKLDSAAEPSVRVINTVLFGLLDGDVAALAAHFTLEGQVQDKGWTLLLTPREPALAKLMRSIELSGDSHVRRIVINEASGDRSLITFSAQRDAETLQADEAARFD